MIVASVGCQPDQVADPLVRLTVAPRSLIEGETVTIAWESAHAASCIQTGGSGLEAWTDGAPIAFAGSLRLVAPSAAQPRDYTVGIDCAGAVDSATFTVLPQDGGSAPAIDSFTVNGSTAPTTVVSGAAVTLSWSSTGASECWAGGTFADAWSGPKPPNGSEARTAPDVTNQVTRTATLYCSDTNGQQTETLSRTIVILPEEVAPPDCTDRPPPPELARAAYINFQSDPKNAHSFEEVFGAPWPGLNNTQRIAIVDGQYAAMRFTVSSTVAPDAISGINVETFQPGHPDVSGGQKLWSVSRCPGDWRLDAITEEQGPGCVFGGPFGQQPSFGGPGFVDDPNRCGLLPGETYYLNLVYTDATPGTPNDDIQSSCLNLRCGNIMAPTFNGGWGD